MKINGPPTEKSIEQRRQEFVKKFIGSERTGKSNLNAEQERMLMTHVSNFQNLWNDVKEIAWEEGKKRIKVVHRDGEAYFYEDYEAPASAPGEHLRVAHAGAYEKKVGEESARNARLYTDYYDVGFDAAMGSLKAYMDEQEFSPLALTTLSEILSHLTGDYEFNPTTSDEDRKGKFLKKEQLEKVYLAVYDYVAAAKKRSTMYGVDSRVEGRLAYAYKTIYG